MDEHRRDLVRAGRGVAQEPASVITEPCPREQRMSKKPSRSGALGQSESNPTFKQGEWWQSGFAMVTRGFIEEFCFAMSRNAWILYLALATFYNLSQRRSFPTNAMLFAVCSLSRFSRSRALRQLLDLGLVEVWGEKRGRRRRTFYRLLHVDAGGHHVARRQQHTFDELREWAAEGRLPPGYGWVQRAYVKSGGRVCAWQ